MKLYYNNNKNIVVMIIEEHTTKSLIFLVYVADTNWEVNAMLIHFPVTCYVHNACVLSLYVCAFYMFITLLLSETQTDESDVEPEPPEVPSQLEQDYEAARNEIQILKEQLKITQLEVSKKEAEMTAFKEAAVLIVS